MTQEEKLIRYDRMRYTKNKLSSGLALLAILFDVLYFVNIYQSDVGTFYYNWVIGVSVVYNLIFLLTVFLSSEGVKSRKPGYTYIVIMILVGLVQFGRIFFLPMKAHAATIMDGETAVAVMTNGQFTYTCACLAISGVLCIACAVTSFLQNRDLENYLKSLNQSK